MTSKGKEVPKRPGVQHHYRDWANASAADVGLWFPTATNGGVVRQQNPMASGTQQQGFAVKLHHMLSDVEAFGESGIVSWQPHGRCFVVRDRKAFVERILPSYFLQSNFASFQRQLNLYGFKRLSSAQDRGGYYHELFLRGKPEFACFIQRIKRKGTGPRKPDAPENEPNFFAMPYLPLSAAAVRQAPAPAFPVQVRCVPQMALPPLIKSGVPKLAPPQKQVAAVPTLKHLLPGAMASSAAAPPAMAATTAPPMPSPQPLQAPLGGFLTGLLQPTPIGPSSTVVTGSPSPATNFSPVFSVVIPYGSAPTLSADSDCIDQWSGLNAASIPPIDTVSSEPRNDEANNDWNLRENANMSPTSWDNAFGEEEDFWFALS
ncbi:Heat stress transcription factor [Seminavis robusta]|uniref:Heat stress transcription factor n=1 Tax=Seminavis robusta TaxID=568900 RepID=A0A9N8ENS4_9STRA|nr:Heat stress transcription factor [Seminavis robusta]|eukprot:Sro1409_g270210.1 Heat stress transcription factor (375) ;mRNA; f:21543-23029